MIRGDFHLHTCYSYDTKTTLQQVIERCHQTGLNCVAVTDHDTIQGALALQAMAPFRVIIGEEITSSQGHIIGLFLSRHVAAGQSARQTLDAIHEQGGIAVAPHPYSRLCDASLRGALEENIDAFDAIEIANSNNFIPQDNARAAWMASRHNKPVVSGSDAHRPNGIGSNIVEMPDFYDAPSFVRNLAGARLIHRIHPISYFMVMGLREVGVLSRNVLTSGSIRPSRPVMHHRPAHAKK